MTEEKKNIETQNNADFMGDGMPAGRAQNIKGTLKRFFKDLMKQRGKIIFMPGSFCRVHHYNAHADWRGNQSDL